MSDASTTPAPPRASGTNPERALIGWRVLAMIYDALPVLALWLLVGAVFTVGYTLAGHPVHENIRPFSALQWLEWLCCWLIAGAYAVLSWRRGGQTLGMRPWRLRVTDPQGDPAATGALAKRYAWAALSLLLAGAGFWWAWFDRDRLTWHDRLSGTRMRRLEKRSAS